jgi:hypothetical protein
MEDFNIKYKNKKMQPKESKSAKHFYISMIKSFFRIVACVCLGYKDFVGAALLLGVAEALGVAEEF